MLIWVFACLAAVFVAVVVVGVLAALSRGLGATEATAIYDLEEATDYVADRLPTAIHTKLDREDLQALLLWHLEFLRTKGMATFGGVDHLANDAAFGAGDVVADVDDATDYVLARAARSGRGLDAIDAVVVVEYATAYLGQIGALGPSQPIGGAGGDPVG